MEGVEGAPGSLGGTACNLTGKVGVGKLPDALAEAADDDGPAPVAADILGKYSMARGRSLARALTSCTVSTIAFCWNSGRLRKISARLRSRWHALACAATCCSATAHTR